MDFRSLVSGMELLNDSQPLQKLAWGAIVVVGLFGVAAVITALRWW